VSALFLNLFFKVLKYKISLDCFDKENICGSSFFVFHTNLSYWNYTDNCDSVNESYLSVMDFPNFILIIDFTKIHIFCFLKNDKMTWNNLVLLKICSLTTA
jgi:hypothetical protein